jgi:nitrate reductase assembly molybdenum cofactor insertion protein NarJ
MMSLATDTLAELTKRARSAAMASVVASYPSDDLMELGEYLKLELSTELHQATCRALAEGRKLDDLRSMYLELFDRGGGRASLYETEYGHMRGLAKGHDLADIAGFYRAFGFELDDESEHELVDHIAVELEFYAVMLCKEAALHETADAEGLEIVGDARRKFLREHLGRLALGIAGRPEVTKHDVYGPIFAAIAKWVQGEAKLEGVAIDPLDFVRDAELKSSMECGAVHLPVFGQRGPSQPGA